MLLNPADPAHISVSAAVRTSLCWDGLEEFWHVMQASRAGRLLARQMG